MKKLQNFFKGFLVYLTIAGLVTFSLFICEEAFQTAMFGTWPAKDAGAWHVVKKGTEVMRSANRLMKIINYTAGYIQPLAFFAYRAYGISADYYIEALETEIMANAPELFVGNEITIIYKNKAYSLKNGNREYRVGKITVITSNEDHKKTTGVLRLENNKLIIRDVSSPQRIP